MKKIILLCLLLFPISVNAISFKSGIVVNRSNNDILYEENIHEELPIASLTKIMTTMVSLENINDLNKEVIVTSDDISSLLGYQTIGLKENDKVTYEELIYSTIMYSAADSAKTLSNHVFDNNEEFITKMNELANKLNMKNTKFSNPIGMDEDNYSSSYDLYLLLDYALNNENFKSIYTTKKYKINSLDRTITNNINNKIKKENIETNVYFDGYKGGYTNLSGLSFSGITNIDNNELIVITIGSDNEISKYKHIKDAIEITNNIKDNYSNRVVLEKNKLIDNIIYKDKSNYEIRSKNKHTYFMDNKLDLNYIKTYYEGKTNIDDSIKDKEIIGKIKVYYNDKLLSEEEVIFNKNDILKNKKDYKNLLIFIGICLFGLIIFRKKK